MNFRDLALPRQNKQIDPGQPRMFASSPMEESSQASSRRHPAAMPRRKGEN